MRLLLAVLLFCTSAVAGAVDTKDLLAEAVIMDGGSLGILQSYQGTCKAGSKRIILVMTDGVQFGAFVGCWKIEGDVGS
jgi:hypothetical protein